MKKLLAIVFGLVLVFRFVTTVSAALPTDLVGWWRFENNTLDETSNNNDGTLQNGATYDAAGKIGSALKLDGTNDYMSIPFSTSLNFTAAGQDFSAEAWINAASGGAIDVIYTQEDGGGYEGRYWLRVTTDNRIQSNIGNSITQTLADVITRGEWHHVAVTFDKGAGQTGTLKIYVDGIERASSTCTLETSTGNYRIGVGNTGSNDFKGLIDEVSLWKKALSAEELNDYDLDGFTSDVDCNDTNADIHPGATEECDGVDNNCTGGVDEGLVAPPAGNQNGVCSGSAKVCSGTGGWVEPDYTKLPYYEDPETRCDTLDNNCDGEVDEGGICEFSCTSPTQDTAYKALGLGVNRWVYDGKWITTKPKGKGTGPTFTPTLADTHKCGCEQILTWLHDNLPETYGAMNGHWKYGCSQSAIQDFMSLADEAVSTTFAATASLYYDGPTNSAPLYGSGPITFTWNPYTGHM